MYYEYDLIRLVLICKTRIELRWQLILFFHPNDVGLTGLYSFTGVCGKRRRYSVELETSARVLKWWFGSLPAYNYCGYSLVIPSPSVSSLCQATIKNKTNEVWISSPLMLSINENHLGIPLRKPIIIISLVFKREGEKNKHDARSLRSG